MQNTQQVGFVKALYRYPVKSMKGESLDQVQVWWHGFEADRRYAFIRADNSSRFPWLTAREVPTMLQYMPYFVEPTNPVDSDVQVRMPDGQEVALDSSELHQQLTSLYKGPIYLLQSGRGFFDSMDLSLISTATVNAIGEGADVTLDPLRFRPNILIEAFEDALMPENAWVDGLLIFGERDTSASMRVNRKDARCIITNLDPATSDQKPSVLRTIVRNHGQCAGVYGSPERTGTIQVGDVIRMVKE